MIFGNKFGLATIALVVIAVDAVAQAKPETESVVNCFTANTTEEDKLAILKLLAITMASHPDVGDVVTVDPVALEGIEEQIGEYIERLLIIDCLPEARASLQADNGRGMLIAAQTVMASVMRSLQSELQATGTGNRLFSDIEKDRIKTLLTDE